VVSFTPRLFHHFERATGTHWIRGFVGLRAGLDNEGKQKFLTLPALERREHKSSKGKEIEKKVISRISRIREMR
jgi:hypothetical protein